MIVVKFSMDKSSISGSIAKLSQLIWILEIIENWVFEEVE